MSTVAQLKPKTRYDAMTGTTVPLEEPAAQDRSGDALAILRDLTALLADPKAAAKRVAEFAEAASKAREADAAVKQAQADRDAVLANIADAQRKHTEKLDGERTAHEHAIQLDRLALAQRERAVAKRERELEERETKLKADRAKLDRKLAAVRDAATD